MTPAHMTQADLDAAWDALASNPVRRALLGRKRCDALAAIAGEEVRYESRAGANFDGFAAAHMEGSRRRIGHRIARRYPERCGFAFTTLILSWAISAIVQALIARWWANRHPTEPTP